LYTNGINSYTKVQEEKPKLTSQSFEFNGETFSNFMGKEEEPAPNNLLRESARELAEDDAILSTDEENREMARRGQESPETTAPQINPQDSDKARLLRLMDISNQINMINISKSKKEVENTVGPAVEEQDEPEDITSIVAKMNAFMEERRANLKNDDIETNINMENGSDDFEDENPDNSQVLHETEEELREDMSILSTEEENLEMARRNSGGNTAEQNYQQTENEMMFLNDIVALNNQMKVEQDEIIQNTQNAVNLLMSKVEDDYNRMDLSELTFRDVDCIIGFLRMGTGNPDNYTDENNDELEILSEKFLAMLRDSIINKKVFRIDFDNDISVIIRINKEGQMVTEFLTDDDAIATYLKNNLHILREKFDELQVNYEDITYRNTNER